MEGEQIIARADEILEAIPLLDGVRLDVPLRVEA
jgi:hypothetical protein